jgi:hypothetical protein
MVSKGERFKKKSSNFLFIFSFSGVVNLKLITELKKSMGAPKPNINSVYGITPADNYKRKDNFSFPITEQLSTLFYKGVAFPFMDVP